MSKIIEKNTGKILIFVMFVLVMSSCQTVRDITMSDSKRATQCNWVNNR